MMLSVTCSCDFWVLAALMQRPTGHYIVYMFIYVTTHSQNYGTVSTSASSEAPRIVF